LLCIRIMTLSLDWNFSDFQKNERKMRVRDAHVVSRWAHENLISKGLEKTINVFFLKTRTYGYVGFICRNFPLGNLKFFSFSIVVGISKKKS